jgi:hypothetical protein
MIDILLLVIIGVVTYCVASEGPWGAASTFVAVILAGLVAMNYFETVAGLFPATIEWQARADIIALLGLFAAGVTGLRMGAEYLMPTQVEVHPLAYDAGRWGFGALSGFVTAAIVLTSLHTAPLPREFLGFTAERNNFFELGGVENAPDRLWLAFTQHASENIFTTGNVFDRSVYERYRGRAGGAESWSSFPIRYADRRERYASSGVVAAGAGTSSAPGSANAPPPPVTPTPGGGASPF